MKRAVTLKENHEFRRLYQKGKSAVGGGMVLYCRKNRLDHNRLGLTVSTKVGGAVVRNRVRRRLREIYRAERENLLPGYDLVVVARARCAGARYGQMERDFRALVRRLELRKEEDRP